ncbi:uncharacterized protein LOC143275845 [Babylonia areolata]|uniref:uncharacterized protein LOC143275845 n=1 Tax=Babylonia areolata TaxID=304850 RepID=UPI003FD31F89
MDEGRLAVVLRQEEQHRKFVYMMNDIVRARFGLYSNWLSREQHDSSVKLVKNCTEVKRSIVRQRVLRNCLEMRKRKIVARDPTRPFGQYGGKPLWAMSRDIDHVIANNHPKIRRMRHVEQVMRQSLESGAILDEAAITRRMEAFLQLKKQHPQQQQQQQRKSPERRERFLQQAPTQRRNFFKPPSRAADSEGATQGNRPSQTVQPPASADPQEEKKSARLSTTRRDSTAARKESATGKVKSSEAKKEPPDNEHHKSSHSQGITSKVSLDVDSKGKLQGIKIYRKDSIYGGDAEAERKNPKSTRSTARTEESRSPARTGRTEQADVLIIRSQGGDAGGGSNITEGGKKPQYRASDDKSLKRSRSKLILPPIEPTKAMVSRR